MASREKKTRHRVGRVSFYEHHGGWWIYHRELGKPVRRHVGDSAALAECEASLLNAQFIARSAGFALGAVPAVRTLGLERPEKLHGESLAALTDSPTGTCVSDLRRAFLAHHENVLHSSLATVSRYHAATLYLQAFAEREKIVDPLQVPLTSTINDGKNSYALSTKILTSRPSGHLASRPA